MEWLKFYTDWHDHERTCGVPLASQGLWLNGLSWVGAHRVDGFIPTVIVKRLIPGDEDVAALIDPLVASGLWGPVEGGFMFRDFAERQAEAIEVQQRRIGAREAGRLGGLRSAESRLEKYGTAQPRSSPEALPEAPPEASGCRSDLISRSSLEPPFGEALPKRPKLEEKRIEKRREEENKTVANAPVRSRSNPQSVQDHEDTASSTREPVKIGEIVHANYVGHLVDKCVELGMAEPGSREKARFGKEAKELAETRSPETVLLATDRMVERNRPLGSLLYLAKEIERERAGHPVGNGRSSQAQFDRVISDLRANE